MYSFNYAGPKKSYLPKQQNIFDYLPKPLDPIEKLLPSTKSNLQHPGIVMRPKKFRSISKENQAIDKFFVIKRVFRW